MLLIPGRRDFGTYRVPLFLLATFALLMLLQLVPLPPDLWASLGGNARYTEASAAAGLSQPWRPLSLAPDLTLNSLLDLLPPFAVLIGFASLHPPRRTYILLFLISAACLSAFLGVAQLTSARSSPVFLYAVAHEGSPIGFFSNRNHQAAFLALAFPLLRSWVLMPAEKWRYRRVRFWSAVAISLFLIPMILVTGSRAGLVLALVGLVTAFLIDPRLRLWRGGGGTAWTRFAFHLLWITPVLLIGLALFFGRAVAIDRLMATEGLTSELRVQNTPLMLKMIGDFFPFGFGFGAFDSIFRGFEPDSALSPFYFNHAHNDLIELALTGGIPALLLLAGLLFWWLRRAFGAWRPLRAPSPATVFARLGASIMLILFLASLVDYPLRTPLMATIFAIACGWLAGGVKSGKAATRSPKMAD
ncbi:O-antigen ligase family protein [Allosphingosinicella sp.]|uniref:O-antigen ligase family protein n=1 Tax=Allosphingosinicella sp. TaxID=2823234 RepID=UPI0037849E07